MKVDLKSQMKPKRVKISFFTWLKAFFSDDTEKLIKRNEFLESENERLEQENKECLVIKNRSEKYIEQCWTRFNEYTKRFDYDRLKALENEHILELFKHKDKTYESYLMLREENERLRESLLEANTELNRAKFKITMLTNSCREFLEGDEES